MEKASFVQYLDRNEVDAVIRAISSRLIGVLDARTWVDMVTGSRRGDLIRCCLLPLSYRRINRYKPIGGGASLRRLADAGIIEVRHTTARRWVVPVPIPVLHYLAKVGSLSEIVVALLAACRTIPRQNRSFRFNQKALSRQVGLSRKALNVAVRRLRAENFIEEVPSLLPAIKLFGKKYRWVV